MEILTRTAEIKSAIRELFADPSDERVAAVAFVGADALSFIPHPNGLQIYCWPQPGGTHPTAIEDLIRHGAHVHFVERLHAKIYWSRRGGSLIGSANLTSNALGEDALQEAVVRFPAGVFDIGPFIRSLRMVGDFAAKLKWLQRAHIAYMQRNPGGDDRMLATPRLMSFAEWLSSGKLRQEWRLGWWDTLGEAPEDAVQKLEEETGSRQFATFLGVKRASDLRKSVFTLSFEALPQPQERIRLRRFEWWAPETRVLTTSSDCREYPYLWFARRRIPQNTIPPFDHHDSVFRRALARTIREMGGMKWLKNAPLKPSAKYLRLLEDHFMRLR